MRLDVKVETHGKLTETLTPARLESLLWSCGYIIENHVVSEVDRLGLVDEGVFRNTISVVPPVGNQVKVTDGVFYGIYLEMGTRPHIIRPKNKKALHWVQDGADMFAKVVHHPGTRAYRPFTNGLISSQHDVLNKVKSFTVSA